MLLARYIMYNILSIFFCFLGENPFKEALFNQSGCGQSKKNREA
jgi:hypothetical protein